MKTGRIKSIIIDNQYIAIGVITVYALISLINVDDINLTYRNNPLETQLKNLCDKILIDTNYRAQCTILYDKPYHKRSIGFSIR